MISQFGLNLMQSKNTPMTKAFENAKDYATIG